MQASSIGKSESIYVEEGVSWMDPIKSYLEDETLPKDKNEVDNVKKQSISFYLENSRLYKCNFLMPLLMYLNEEEAKYVLRELHEGIYGSHIIGSSLTLKTLRNGYFWPTMKVDAPDLVKRCNKCQRHAYVPRKPSVEQTPLVVAWPFE